ncbi:YcjF family protein [Marichromatium gracile]|uniref:G domain-containing protein n=1 Tax=Marichromatium gracile TaxID=1048 RepID=A0ABR5VGZ9_MARGR|nr:DUF697 domain-containing protein [Marichromatium gracile]KXX64754.1 hypothetical protein AY586_12525 [Marichromatium gracile]
MTESSDRQDGEGWRARWRRVREVLLDPRVDEAALERTLAAARERHPPPVVWLVGKTQSGKSSIVRTLTASSAAEVGDGFRPCTRTARLYDFPAELPLVRFLDTRGLGEIDYDPAEDIRFCESQSHLLLAVMKVADPDQQAVFEVLREVRRRHPEWPVVVAQTGLHELYAQVTDPHPTPYPFDQDPWPMDLPNDLVRALRAQRDALGELPGTAEVRWVAIDLTLPEDGFAPPDYGIEALWSALDGVSSLRLTELLRADPEVRDLFARSAHPHIVGYALTAAGVGALPAVDLVGVPAIQAKLLQSLAALYGQPWSRREISEFLGLLGIGVGAAYATHAAGRALVKLVPGLGQTLGALWGASASGATTYALGKAAGAYFNDRRHGVETQARALRARFAAELERGRALVGRGRR